MAFQPAKARAVRCLAKLLRIVAIFVLATGADAQTLKSPAQLEAEATRRDLTRLAQEPGEVGEAARNALKFLDAGAASGVRQPRSAFGSTRIVNGTTTTDYPASGALLRGEDRRSARITCSGTLIGCRTFLTAAHCFLGDPHSDRQQWSFDKPQQWKVFFQHVGIFDVEKIDWMGETDYVHPTGGGSRADVAIVRLKRPVEGVTPVPVKTEPRVAFGTPALIIGFGRTGGGNQDYGVKRTGDVITQKCHADTYSDNLLCWKYDAAIVPGGARSNTCNADSGGGLHVDSDELISGVTSGGQRRDCLAGDRSYNTDLVSYLSWVEKQRADDITTKACGTGPAIDVAKHVRGEEATLDAKVQQFQRTFDVAANTATLRVALNGVDDDAGTNDFDLYLINGASSDIAGSVCREEGEGQFGFCEVANPAPGPWTAVVKRKKGEGLFQLVVTRIPR